MALIDFKLEKRFTGPSNNKTVKLSFSKTELVIRIPITAEDHKPTNPVELFRTVEKEIQTAKCNFFMEPSVKFASGAEKTSSTRLTAVIEFDSKKPNEEGL